MSTVLRELVDKFSKALSPGKAKAGGVAIGVVFLAFWYTNKKARKTKRPKLLVEQQQQEKVDKNGKIKGTVDSAFFKRLAYVLKIAIPSIYSRESGTAVVLAVVLILRTFMTILMSSILANFVRSFCSRDWTRVRNVILTFSSVAIPASVLNASLKYFTQALNMGVREKLTLKIHEMYMKNMNYYTSNKVGVDKLEHTDQLIAEDISLFSESLSEVYSSLLKPVTDFIIFSIQLQQMLGTRGPVTMCLYFCFASVVSSIVLPSYGRLAVQSQKLEGTFRARHNRLIENAEMIAFNGGEAAEKNIIDQSFKDIKSHEKYSRWRQLGSNIIMGYFNKYLASVFAMIVVVIPLAWNEKGYQSYTASDIASYYVESSRVMTGQAEAVLQIFELQKLIGKLSGLTLRVWTLINRLEHPEPLNLPKDENNPPQFIEKDSLNFKNVSIYKPDGTLLVKDLDFPVPRGTRVIITGENGCGKSSLFRVLRGLWPLAAGTIETPPRHSLKSFYFLSQANFVPIGSLREVIIYPHLVEDMRKEGKTDDDLWEVLKMAHLSNLTVGEKQEKPNMDTVLDWQTILSPGQKQRIAFARLLYHHPIYAVLDECTNGIAPDVEADLYERCRKMGITVFSISHKLELKKLHDYELNYDGKGGYKWIKLHEDK